MILIEFDDSMNDSEREVVALTNLKNIILNSISNVIHEDKLYNLREFTQKEKIEWFDNLPQSYFETLAYEYHLTKPTLEYDLDFKCDTCGHDNHYKLDSFTDFFSF